MPDASALPPGANDPPGSSDGRPDGTTVVTSPQATIEAELPADGASGKADSLAVAPLAAAEAGALDPGAIDAPVAARIAIA